MKKRFTKLPGSTHMLSLFFALILSVWGTYPAWADEITVYDETGSSTYYPVHGNYADFNGSISEFIIPATTLTELDGSTISKLTFYVKTAQTKAWGATFKVYLKEVTSTVYESSSAYGDTDATEVYSGTLDASGSTMEINFTTNYTYNGGNLLIGTKVISSGTWTSAEFYGETQSSYTAFRNKSSNTREKFIPKTTLTYTTPSIDGAALLVKDGSTKITSPYAFDFGLATAETTKTFTLSNPGTAAVEGLSVSETGSFGATLSATSIAAGGEATLTITMPAATGSSAITISSTTKGIADFVINANGTVRDNEKIYIDFDENALPATWTLESGWSVNSTSHVATIGGTQAYIRTPEIISEGESLMIQYKGNGTISWYSYSGYSPVLIVYTSTDNNSWDEGQSVTISDNDLHTASFTIPSSAKYIAIAGKYLDIDYIYGCKEVAKPLMVVTQPASLNYGAITENTAKTFTIANTGLATLEGISVTSSNAAFTMTGAPTSLAAGESKEVTITLSAANVGNFSSDITVSATSMDNVQFTVSGTVLPTGLSVIDFNDNTLPARWENSSTSSYSSGWTFSDGAAYTSYYTCTMTTPKIIVNDGDMFVIKAKLNGNYSSYYVTINGSSDNGETWTAYTKKLSTDVLNSTDYTAVLLSDIPSTVNKLQFVGYYAYIDEIQGINYAADLVVTDSESAAQASGLNYDFGECAADASVTYNFANTGAGTINITNVAITGEGAAAYSTNWSASVACPFELIITRSYNADRTGAQAAVVTVTTTEGEFVINVTGSDKAANAPELAVSTDALNFGKVTADAVETVTVTNNGTGSMTVDIASDSENFVVSATQLTEIGAGESKTFDITFKYGTPYGVKNGNITVTPTYNTEHAKTITVTGKAKDPETWSEDFTAGVLPTGWDAGSSWTIADGVAKGTWASSASYLTTAPLTVSATTDELTFDYTTTANSVSIAIQMSKNGGDWETCNATPAIPTYMSSGTTGTATITGLEAGTYQFRFKNDDYNLDNFEGFKLNLPDHMASISAYNIPESSSYSVTMKEGQSFEASVTVKEQRGVAEELTAKLYMGADVIGTQTGSVAANGTETLTITCTPTTAATSGAQMHIEVEWAGATLTTENVTRYVAAITYLTLDETSSDAVAAGTYDNVTLKRQFNAGWNTVCLPFTISNVETIFGTGAIAYEFSSYSDGALGFTSVTSLTASYPYIVYVPSAITENVALTDITIASLDANPWYTRKTDSSNNAAYFRGTYAPIAAGNWVKNAETDNIYGVTSEGKIAKAGATASIKGFRAYFDLPAGVGAPTAVFEDATTGIKTMVNAGELQLNGEVYNLSGQKVQNAKKGLYIVNGRKVVVK